MLAREDNAFMVPVVGTGFGVVEERVVPSVVVWDNTPSRFEGGTSLVREATVPALVPI
jgi:hypothetical protein